MIYASLLLFFITTSTAIISRIPIGSEITGVCTKPATIYVTQETAATMIA